MLSHRSLSRRNLLQVGALGIGGVTLADLLRAEGAKSGAKQTRKAVINIHLDGGPPQMDLIDPKPEAPREVRGEFEPIATKLPGVMFTELLPQLAQIADRLILIRSLVGADGNHDAFQCQSGYLAKELQSLGGRPALGCVAAKLLGAKGDAAPTFVDLMQGRPMVRNSARAGFLGPAYQAFRPDISHLFHRELEAGMVTELAQRGHQTTSLTLNPTLTFSRLRERLELCHELDALRKEVDRTGMMGAVDDFSQQAVGILTSGRLAEALDLSREDPAVLKRYRPSTQVSALETSEGSDAALKLLLARRVIEAGVRCVSISLSDYDTHSNNFKIMRNIGPVLDHALSTLILDLEERGLLQDVAVVVWGEFGRTPQINNNAGRDHWPNVGMAILAGGGWPAGRVIGATDRTASRAISQPVHYQDVIATLYKHLGIDLQTTLTDPSGRPQHLLEIGLPLRDLA